MKKKSLRCVQKATKHSLDLASVGKYTHAQWQISHSTLFVFLFFLFCFLFFLLVFQVLTSVNNAQRQELKHTFKSMYGRDLMDDLKSGWIFLVLNLKRDV